MNVFILSDNMKYSALLLDDAHLIAQINEGCQILMANYNHQKYPNAKVGHINHPVTRFYSDIRARDELISYMSDLFNEYLYRFGKEHQNYFWLNGFIEHLDFLPSTFFNYSKTHVENHMTNDIEEIREYIMTKPHVRKLKWTRRRKPYWWTTE